MSLKAAEVLDDDGRAFVCSPFIRMEVLPKALFYRRVDEVAFYRTYFEAVETWVDPNPGLLLEAESLASRFGLSALDALHVTAAITAGVDELVTSERPASPIHRVSGLFVKTIHS